MSHRAIIPSLAAIVALSWGDGCIVYEEVPVVDTVVGYYEPCGFDEQCPFDTNCHDVTIDYGNVIVRDAMCTVACGSDYDCPLDGLCLGATTGPPLCYQWCFDDYDCPAGFGCVQDIAAFSFEPVCMPI